MSKKTLLHLLIASSLFIASILISVAQETLTLSKATTVVKISNPMRIIDEYSPLFKKIDRFIDSMPADVKLKGDKTNQMPSDVAGEIRRKFNDAAINTCIDIRGDVYVAMFMDVEAYREFMAEQMSVLEEGGMKPPQKNDKEQVAKMLKMYGLKVIIPISDTAKFELLFNQMKKKEMADTPVTFDMVDKYAVLSFDKDKTKVTKIDFDVNFKSKYSIATHSSNPGEEYFEVLQENMPILIMPFITPLLDFEKQMLKEVKSTDSGIGMVDDNIMLETFLTPIAGGKLDNSLKNPASPDAANEALAMMPKNIVTAATEIGMGEGYPSSSDIYNVLLKTIAASGSPAKSAPLIKAVKLLQAQTSRGGACAFTLPEDTATSTSSMVLIYDIKSETGARDAMNGIVTAFPIFTGGILNGMMANELKLFGKKDVVKVNGISSDLYRLVVKAPDTTMTGKAPAADMANIEMRVAYVNNKMIVTVGKNSLPALESILKGIDAKDTFIASNLYTGIMEQMPAKGIRNIVFISIPGVVKAGVKTFVPGPDKDKIMKLLTRITEPKSNIVGYDEIKDGDDHTVIIYPTEQIDYIINSVVEITKEMDKKKPTNIPPVRTTKPPVKKAN